MKGKIAWLVYSWEYDEDWDSPEVVFSEPKWTDYKRIQKIVYFEVE